MKLEEIVTKLHSLYGRALLSPLRFALYVVPIANLKFYADRTALVQKKVEGLDPGLLTLTLYTLISLPVAGIAALRYAPSLLEKLFN